MGRELKRVALDFEWPLEEVWSGYLNPVNFRDVTTKCKTCKGTGLAKETLEFRDRFYGHSHFKPDNPIRADDPLLLKMVKEARPGPGIDIAYEAEKIARSMNSRESCHLTQADVDALIASRRLPEGLTANEANIRMALHHSSCSLDFYRVAKARAEALGIPITCPDCDGEGSHWNSDEERERYESWESEEPPSGEGWQMWETVSEGSPISPVFETAEELARWLALRRWGADWGTSYEDWLSMIKGSGYACSMVWVGNETISGVTYAARYGNGD